MSGPDRIRQSLRARREKIAAYLRENALDAAVLADFEGQRNRSVRYLTGHPMDALLFLFASGESLLLPWDTILAEATASVEEVRPYTQYGRAIAAAVKKVLPERQAGSVELSGAFSYPLVRELSQALPQIRIVCREGGIDGYIQELRAVKDAQELEALRRACRLTDELVAAVEGLLAGAAWVSETVIALYLETEARQRGAERMGFETLAAGPSRSFAIHCFPAYTGAAFGTQGFSILDFGVCFDGYSSDITLTFIRGPMSPLQQRMLEAVTDAYELALSLVRPGADPAEIAGRIDRLLASQGFQMPHGLGHGIGLDAHEAPYLRAGTAAAVPAPLRPLRPGVVFTVEPGLYHSEAGGVRLENDVLCTERGAELLTGAHFIRL